MGEGAGSLGRDFGQELLFVCLVFLSLFGEYITESEYNILTISYPFVSLRSPVLAVHLTMNLRGKCCAHFSEAWLCGKSCAPHPVVPDTDRDKDADRDTPPDRHTQTERDTQTRKQTPNTHRQ
jgi:hypothetical protein